MLVLQFLEKEKGKGGHQSQCASGLGESAVEWGGIGSSDYGISQGGGVKDWRGRWHKG